MYGMVNNAIEEMVREHHGDDAWERIRDRAGIETEVFISNETYSDDVTFSLVAAASAELGVPAPAILEAFGEYFVLETGRRGYSGLFEAHGETLEEFLVNLPNFHSRVTLLFPDLQPPRFEFSERTGDSILIHYHTHRSGLAPFMHGLLVGLGKLYETPIEIAHEQRRDEGADHDTFRVSWRNAA